MSSDLTLISDTNSASVRIKTYTLLSLLSMASIWSPIDGILSSILLSFSFNEFNSVSILLYFSCHSFLSLFRNSIQLWSIQHVSHILCGHVLICVAIDSNAITSGHSVALESHLIRNFPIIALILRFFSTKILRPMITHCYICCSSGPLLVLVIVYKWDTVCAHE